MSHIARLWFYGRDDSSDAYDFYVTYEATVLIMTNVMLKMHYVCTAASKAWFLNKQMCM